MKAVEYLRREHRRIEEMLVALEAAAIQVETSGTVPSFIADLLDFFQLFADLGHHAKEESLLFPALARHGVSPEGTVGAMVHQHHLGRVHVRDMRRAIERLQLGDPASRSTFAASAYAYIELLRVHIQIEDDDLYPLADELLDADEKRDLVHEFETADHSRKAIAQHARWEALVARIHEPVRH